MTAAARVGVAQVTYQTGDMREPDTGLGIRWQYGWIVAFPDGQYEIVHDPYVIEAVPA